MKNETAIAAWEQALTGQAAHPHPLSVLESLDEEIASRRLPGAPHTILELVEHLIGWQDLTIRWLRGEEPPESASEEDAWPRTTTLEDAVGRFRRGFESLREALLTADVEAPLPGLPEASRLSAAHVLAAHNSYHVGQIALLTRLLRDAPSG